MRNIFNSPGGVFIQNMQGSSFFISFFLMVLLIICVPILLGAQTTIFTQNFDGSWTNAASLSPAWICPQTGNNEWHKNSYTTGWTSGSSGAFSPTGAQGTGNAARFHSYAATTGSIGEFITPTLNLSAYTSGINRLSFCYINTAGTDYLDIYLSTDDGLNWGPSFDAGAGTGGVTFLVKDGAVFTENPPTITASGTISDRIVFQRDNSGSTRPLIKPTGGTAATDAGICLQGSDYVTFDGIDISINSGSALEFGFCLINESPVNGAQYNTIRNSRITLNRDNKNSKAILQDIPINISNAGGANSYNVYDNLVIENVYQGIHLLGFNGTYPDVSCVVSNSVIGANTANDIGNSNTAINVLYLNYQNSATVNNNEIRNATVTGSADLICCYLNSCEGNNLVYNNRIHDLKSTGTSTSSLITAMQLTITNTTKVYNNVIYGFSHAITTANATQVAFGIKNTGSGTVDLSYNTVSMNLGPNASNSAFYNTSGTVNSHNNIFANFSTTGVTSKRYCVYVNSGTMGSSSHNILFINPGTNNFTGYKTSDYSTLQGFAAALSPASPSDGMESGSSAADPGFASSTDLSYPGSTPAAQSGSPVSGITTDINGQARDSNRPSIGAFEASGLQLDRSAVVISNVNVANGTSPVVSVTATIADNGNIPYPATVRLWCRLQGSSTAFTGLDADSKPAGSINGEYGWNTSISALPPGTYEFYMAARDGQGAGSGIWVNPIWKTSFAGFSATDPPNFVANPDASVNIRTFTRPIEFSGTYYIGTGEAYPTVKAAVDALATAGNLVTGNVFFELTNTYVGEGSTPLPIVLGNYAGVSESNQIYFRPKADVVSTLATSFDPGTGNSIIKMDGARYVNFDGRSGGIGTEIRWIIRNTRTASVIGPTFLFINDASFISLSWLQVEGQSTVATTGTILFSTTTGSSGNDLNTIAYCHIRDRSDGSGLPVNAITSIGTSGKENSNNVLNNNYIYNFFSPTASSYGIKVGDNNSDWSITNNHLYQTVTRTATSGYIHYGIYLENTGNSHSITGNFIGGSSPSCGGSAWTLNGNTTNRFVGIWFGSGTITPSSIQNNTLSNFRLFTSSTAGSANGVWTGIYAESGAINIGTEAANQIGSSTLAGSISVTSLASGSLTSLVTGISISSTATVQISNNIVSGISCRSESTAGFSFKGINASGTGGSFTIEGNTIGSSILENAVQIGVEDSTSAKTIVVGIDNATTGTIHILSNSISQMSSAGANTGSQIIGIRNTDGVATLSQNSIHHLTTASSNTGSYALVSAAGIIQSSDMPGCSVTQNHIYSLTNSSLSGTISLYGIYYVGATSGTNIIARNYIHSLRLMTASTTAQMNGIRCYGGSSVYHNNMISLGIDAEGNSLTTGYNIRGVYESDGANQFYFNSIYVGGQGISGTTSSTYAFASTVTNKTRVYKNNIFYNARSGGSDGFHYAILVGGSGQNPTGITIDYNLYLADGDTGGIFGDYQNNDRISLTAWQNAIGQDKHSRTGDPGFINPGGDVSTVDLHISAGLHTPAERWGLAIETITEDFDGDLRSSLTPTDMGADAGIFIGMDANSQVNNPVSQIGAGNIPSTATDPASAIEVFTFSIDDPGSSDLWPTRVNTLTISNANPSDGADWTNHIDASITIPLPEGELEIDDGTSKEITLYVYLNFTNLQDGKKLQFSIPSTGHGCVAGSSGSTFASTFDHPVLSNEFTIAVSATKMNMTTPATFAIGSFFEVWVEATDDNGNRDRDVTTVVNLDLTIGSGNLLSATGLSQPLSEGEYTWTDLTYDALGYLRVQAASAGLATAVSDTIISSHEAAYGDSSGYYYYPFGTFEGYIRNAALYKADEILKFGQILNLGWNVAIGSYYYTPIKIYLKKVTDSTIIYDTWDNLTADATLVYEGSVQFIDRGWRTFELSAPYNYDSDNLMVLTEMNYGNWGTGYYSSTRFNYHYTYGMNATAYSSQLPPTGYLQGNSLRPSLKIGFPADMIYFNSNTLQDTTAFVDAGGGNQKVLCVQVNTLGNQNAVIMNELTFNASGTEDLTEISHARVYYTGNSPVFTTDIQYGTEFASPGISNFTISGSQSLVPGANYFWLTYDISSVAVGYHLVDGSCTQLTVNGVDYVPHHPSPYGAPLISQKEMAFLYVSQAEGDFAPVGSNNNPVLRIDFMVYGSSTGTLLLNSITAAAKNTSNNDLAPTGVRLYCSGDNLQFSTDHPLGDPTGFISGSAVFTGLNYNIPSGTSSIWLTYDISASAQEGDTVDAMIAANHITVGGETFNAYDEDPDGFKTLVQPISGNVTVGTGGDYLTLTGNNGLFEMIRNTGLSANLNVRIISNLDEPGTFGLQQWTESGAGNYSVIIQPSDGVVKNITGSMSNSGLIRMEGCDRVTIDGSDGGSGQYLSFHNTNPDFSSVITLFPGSHDIQIRNCLIRGAGDALETSGISMEYGDQDNFLLENNKIFNASFGIYIYGGNGINVHNGIISNNTIGDEDEPIFFVGIFAEYCDNLLITGNDISGDPLSLNEESPTGINVLECFNTKMSKNRIHDFGYDGTGGYGCYGIHFQNNNDSFTEISNNFIYNIKADGDNSDLDFGPNGIYIDGGTNCGIWHNTIDLSGNTLGRNGSYDAMSCCIAITYGSSGLDIRNNILINEMGSYPGTTTENAAYTIYSEQDSTVFILIDNNDYSFNTPIGLLGYLMADRATLTDWQSATNQDANSVSFIPDFVSTTDLHVISSNDLGTPIAGVTDDIDGDIRSVVSPDIGADETGITVVYSTIEGNINYANLALTPMSNIPVELRTVADVLVDQQNTTLGGHYSFSSVPVGDFKVKASSTKATGSINAIDALFVMKHFVGLQPLTGIFLKAGDVDNTGYLNAIDALLIQKRFVGLIPSFTAGNWYIEQGNVTVHQPGETITANLQALCYGDVNGSFTPSAKTTATFDPQLMGILEVQPFSEVMIPVCMTRDFHLGALSLVIDIQQDIEVTGVNMPADGSLVYAIHPGQLRLTWTNTGGVQYNLGDVIATLRVRVSDKLPLLQFGAETGLSGVDGIPVDKVCLSLPELKWYEETVSQIRLTAYPNPGKDLLHLSYALPVQGNVLLTLYNMLGVEVKQLKAGLQQTGTNQFDLDVRDLPASTYLLRLQTDGYQGVTLVRIMK
ncbi:MAG: right-handed parallel beta-helix repeat-containing protein [Bacteroidetes bacterium]|nr:right-handed parallel beta-helix repeat-containing protein [Bacteroidota bacterium]